jgi:hypothetical protein
MFDAQNEAAILRQGGNWCRFAQLKVNPDGTYSMGTALDCFGDPAGTFHVMGIHLKTKPTRDGNGFYTTEFQIGETDVDHLNLLHDAAPFTAGASTIPELKAETGAIVKGGGSLDTSRPVFLFIYCASKDSDDKGRVFYCVGQFERDGGTEFDPENWSTITYKVKAIDAKGFVCTNPAADTHLTGITAPTLSGNKAAGHWVAGA